jgi:DNA mismatch repair ATPase MutS|tara:strand:+ start:13514 stop:15295 length:1782 start_codon:yes stop_codon:yes gene_type:complete
MNSPANQYIPTLDQHKKDYSKINSTFNLISAARLILALLIILFGYYFFKNFSPVFAVLTLIAIVGFSILLKIHSRLSFKRKIAKAHIEINENELAFLNEEKIPFDDGANHVNPGHAYSYDLDFFGHKSVFHILNRTATFIGSKFLAKNLQTLLSKEEIERNQAAIQELTADITWRQEIYALATITNDSDQTFREIHGWTKTDKSLQSKSLQIISYLFPAMFLGLFAYNMIFDAGLGNWVIALFLLNLAVLGNQLKTIKKELLGSTKIDKILKNYSLILQKIEEKNFTASKLNDLKSQLKNEHETASLEIKKLSSLFGQLENILNPVGAIFLNGFFLSHIHTLRGFRKWKHNHADKIMEWLDVIGEFEAMNSIANFSYNNPEFSFPSINLNYDLSFENLGHPLLNKEKRVTSSVEFTKQKFIILTGSNMSGKSTFLRSLGVNMVLAGIGAPVCASKASFHPIPVYVSMRISDSLNDSESLFFAEVKRLKEVMDAAEKEICFVLLDEILRGTNSDDKRTGTVKVVKKIIAKNAIGAIATHDLKVCDTTAEFPNQLTNKCFEVEIVNNELYFDYKLREGVCKNKSATFLMEKMGVI